MSRGRANHRSLAVPKRLGLHFLVDNPRQPKIVTLHARIRIRRLLAALSLGLVGACSSVPYAVDPASDAPETPRSAGASFKAASSYAEALQVWRSPEDLSDWIGAHFEYDMPRALALSESRRGASGRIPVYRPDEFFVSPTGVCVDLSRFAVETLRTIDPRATPSFLMIEFAPITIAGNTLRLHWLASYRRDGSYYFFADSKRPGHIAGPYASPREFIEEYRRYRGREIVGFRELESHERTLRTIANKQPREERP